MIRIRGARQHNLKNLDVEIPKGKLVVITGPSGSGKSSLAFHTLFAEGQRRYVESLSVYARQFLDQLEKPDVDEITGLSPAIAIEQRGGGLNPRSTVATATEIHDYLRVLWAAIGVPHDPVTGEKLLRMSAADIVEALADLPEGSKVVLLAPVPQEDGSEPSRLLGDLQRQGFIRIRVNGEMMEIDEAARAWPGKVGGVEIVVDRFVMRAGLEARLADSVETALRLCGSEARASVQEPDVDAWRDISFQTSYRSRATGFSIGEITPKCFSFNSHLGACPECNGLGSEWFCDHELFIADPKAPLLRGGIRGWWPKTSARQSRFVRETKALLAQASLPEEASFTDLGEGSKALLFSGGTLNTGWKIGPEKREQSKEYEGLAVEAMKLYRAAKSDVLKRRLSRFMSRKDCEFCHGKRLKPEWLAVKIHGGDDEWLGIQEFCTRTVGEARIWIQKVELLGFQKEVVQPLIEDVHKRLEFLAEVGLDYLSLDRGSGSLSGGEAQRIRLASQLGAGLSGVLYVLDEPSIGLHAEDTGRLIQTLLRLRDLGNTVVVVEHDEAIIRAADHVIDMGPGAGHAGGEILASSPPARLNSATGAWLNSLRMPFSNMDGQIEWGALKPMESSPKLRIRGAREHNLRNLDVDIPLGKLVCLCGPSGSGKSTLADDILRRVLDRHFGGAGETPGACDVVEGLEHIGKFVVADQSPIGRSPRSNPATFTGAFDVIRELFAKLPLSRQRGYGTSRFSFNASGGRCDRCLGNGKMKVEMHFLPDAWIDCPACSGRRFNRETLEVTFKGRSIFDVLEMPIADALEFFRPVPKLRAILSTLDELGLGYLSLGQAANTLSGGEAQRLKLAVELAKPQAPHTLYLFDEPTTGLHFGDVERLLGAFFRLRDAGHSVLVIEHHLDVIAAADHVIELGPGGGANGGAIVAQGVPWDLISIKNSPTGRVLAAQGRGGSPKVVRARKGD